MSYFCAFALTILQLDTCFSKLKNVLNQVITQLKAPSIFKLLIFRGSQRAGEMLKFLSGTLFLPMSVQDD